MKTNIHLYEEDIIKLEKIKSLLEIPPKKREDKICLEIMDLTKDLKLFQNISRTIEHQNLCGKITIINYKPNDIIQKQGEKGDCLYFILHGYVSMTLTVKIDTGIEDKNKDVYVEKNLGELKDGDIFGELSLLYKIPRTSTVVALTETSLIKVDKQSFDKYLKKFLESQLQDQIEFLKLCPLFNKLSEEITIKLGIKARMKKYATGQIILKNDTKCDSIFVIRRGSVKVIKSIKFIKDENKLKRKKMRRNKSQILYYEDHNKREEIEKEKFMELLSLGPNEDDIKEDNYINKNITLEILKIGDIFPSYYAINELYLDVDFASDNPCELIEINISDIKETVPDTFSFIKKYSKPYPSDEFLRRYHYHNESWYKYKNDVKLNIIANAMNKKISSKHDLRTKIYYNKDIIGLKLPVIFNLKNKKMKFK